ncbi:LPS translocon maturation chaperone LptM [Oceanisphaera sp. W20_SRM_FM3]|uniref:LPS translocon maturation chaperone LptM n=1 Tax=Oceanisphaera sp. W20_SRM_FM3 TaxID=3240267 RepID=UPI003F9CE70A
MKLTVFHDLLPIAFENMNEIIRVCKHKHSHPMKIFKLTTLIALCLSLSACGLKGPLTLPETEQQPSHLKQS